MKAGGLVATNHLMTERFPDSKVHGANIGPIRGRQDPCWPHVGPMNFVIWVLHFHEEPGHSFQGNVCLNTQDSNPQVVPKIYTLQMIATFTRGHCINSRSAERSHGGFRLHNCMLAQEIDSYFWPCPAFPFVVRHSWTAQAHIRYKWIPFLECFFLDSFC